MRGEEESLRFVTFVLLFLPILACQTVAPAQPGAGDSHVSSPKTSLQLIAEARQRGEIDDDAATLYRVYSVVDDSKLPPQYSGSLPMKDGTTVLRDAKSRFEALRPETREALRPYLFPKGER